MFSTPGKRALDYLLNRDLSEDMIKQFKIGFALDGWETLLKKVQSKKTVATSKAIAAPIKKGQASKFKAVVKNFVEGLVEFVVTIGRGMTKTGKQFINTMDSFPLALKTSLAHFGTS